jgi:hypothetical protein
MEGFDFVFGDPRAVGDCSIRVLVLVFSCAIRDVEVSIAALRDDAVGAPSVSATSGVAAGA